MTTFHNLLRGLSIAAMLAAFPAPIQAIELYSQAPYESPGGGSTSKLPVPISADDFTPDTNWLVTRVTFGGGWRDTGSPLPAADGTTPIRVAFHADNAGLPAEPALHVFNILADAHFKLAPPGSLWYYDFDLPLPSPVPLDAGTRYWLSVADGRPSPPSNSFMFWERSPEGNTLTAQTDGFKVWQLFTFTDLAFALHGVPEPSTFALVTCALGFAAVARRKRATVPQPRSD